MRTTRRGFVRTAGAGALDTALARGQGPAVVARDSAFDVAVVGAGGGRGRLD